MHMRLVQIEVKSGELAHVRELYEERIIPVLRTVRGCRYAGLMQSMHHPEQCISLTLWESLERAADYERSGVYAGLVEDARPFLLEVSEYKTQLSEDLTLEYVPVPLEPVAKSYPIAASSEPTSTEGHARGAMWLRIVSLKILPGRIEDFKRIYAERAIPTLRGITGCRYVYLLESDERSREVLSVTSWDSRDDADRYEKNGVFEQLLAEQRHNLSGLYQWKQSLGRAQASRTATSDDVMVEHYTVLTGEDIG